MAIKIFIDQGHNPGGVNAGAEGFGLFEQDVTYQVGMYLFDILSRDPRFEARVSRETPEEVLGFNNTSSLAERVYMANSWPADYFLSIHTNANENPAINGTEAYVFRERSQAYYLGEHITEAISKRLGTVNKGVFTAPSFYVLRNTSMPAVLVELAYITNAADAQKLENDQYQFAYAIYEGLLKYFGLENPGDFM